MKENKIVDYIMITIMIIMLMVPVAFWSYGQGIETGKQINCEVQNGR